MRRYVLVLILALTFLLRIIWVSRYPTGFTADEASFGYDAYSILHTGRDQWGNFLPLALKSFGDYKAPLYSYLAIPSIAAFGLNEFAVRLPSVVIGTLAVLVVYLLVKEMVDDKWLMVNKKGLIINRESLAIIASFLLAINPWHVMMSRGAFEANLITLFVPLGVYFFLKGLKKPSLFVYSAAAFGLALFTYHSAKLIVPIVVLGLIFIYRKEIFATEFKKILPSLIIFLIFFLGLVYTFQIGGGARIAERSITNGALEEGAGRKIELIQNGINPFIARILHNKYQVILQRFTSNYLQYFSLKFLFVNGAGEATYGMIPGIGVIYFFEGVLLLGLIPLLFQKKLRNVVIVLITWLLIAPLPAALTTGVGYAGNRALGMVPVLQILESLGFVGWWLFLKRFDRGVYLSVIVLFCLFSVLQIYRFAKTYFHAPSDTIAKGMLYGDLEVSKWLVLNGGVKNVIVSRSLSEPQIFVAFASKWSPDDFQKETQSWGFDESGLSWLDQLPEYSLGNYTFTSTVWKLYRIRTDILLVGRQEDFPKGVIPIKVVNYPSGNPAIFVVDPSQQMNAKID